METSTSGLLDNLIAQVKDKIEVLEKELFEAKGILSKLTATSIDSNNVATSNSGNSVASNTSTEKKTWFDYIRDALVHYNRLVPTRDILSYIGDVNKILDKNTTVKSVSAILTQRDGKGLKRIKVGDNYLIGLPAWFNEDGTIKEQYNKKETQDSLF